MRLSSGAIIFFINALFDTKHPLDAKVEYLSVEQITDTLGQVVCDIIIRIDGVYKYIIEVQMSEDNEMSFRIWNYSYLEALKNMTSKDDVVRITLIPAIVIYLESSVSTPDKLKLEVKDLDGNVHEFNFPTFKVLNYSLAELEEMNLTILSMFHLLKPRNRVKNADTEGRKNFSLEMAELVRELEERMDRAVERGVIDVKDRGVIFGLMKRLYKHLYGGYKEFKEANNMVEKLIITETEKAEARGEVRGEARGEARGRQEVAKSLIRMGWDKEKVAETAGLEISVVESLFKTNFA
jgi:predicted transposase/invertase (TIGR01784 family)